MIITFYEKSNKGWHEACFIRNHQHQALSRHRRAAQVILMKTTQKNTKDTNPPAFDFEKLAGALRREIEEYGSLLSMIYEQQSCLMQTLMEETTKIESQLTANQLATADRSAIVGQLAEELHREKISLKDLPSVVPNELRYLFQALVDEVVMLRSRIKDKTQFLSKLLEQVQNTNTSIINHVFPKGIFNDEAA